MPAAAKNTTVEKPTKKSINFFGKLYKLDLILLTIGLLIWIFVGSFFGFTIVQQLKATVGQKVDNTVQSVGGQPQSQAPTQTTIPGVGTVNIACVQKNVSTDTIQKVFSDNGTKNLSADEKAKLDACVVPGGQATPSGTPAQ
ncbi:hypothetical protein HY024_05310 [Candidatus Curtissbacteria bacterium]|nr:hypothetical protein [Candidatus Curtissbacteria bacterium]